MSREDQQRWLYMDTMNYGTEFFPFSRPWSCTKSFTRVKSFVDAATRSNVRLKCFIDDAALTAEANNKWRKRRERELIKGEKNVPQGMGILLGDMFKACGVEVWYSQGADNDDSLASHAAADNADVLSNDKDMFRYRGAAASYKVFGSFQVHQGRLLLVPKEPPREDKKSSWRDLIFPLPISSPCVAPV
ncbi:hypothetical protein B484DRAFT_459299, partial [Ochromonadaceae sp. CCMP2298]